MMGMLNSEQASSSRQVPSWVEQNWNTTDNQNGRATPKDLNLIVTETPAPVRPSSRPSTAYDEEGHGLDEPHSASEVVALPPGTPSSFSSPLAQSNYFSPSPKEVDRISTAALPPTPDPARRDPNTSAGDFFESRHYAITSPSEPPPEDGSAKRVGGVFDRSIFRDYMEGKGVLTLIELHPNS
ncbi:uncharacterized protein EI90DRAFT_3056408 [Cantharellus anzutake]|uniref:uncharacterized protein n=1 Tax=Cantharellus anzutake TaxID=1750568 RepID=UPI0019081EB4|nr:uncharacterized protein EI90DRAFT_3056408 [Cantharellus anzutake]KAF8332057.1 hypothetical protein EI90DRAFT_3056408 [Cantharellus anzutake]